MTEKEKMLAGEGYKSWDEELMADRERAKELTFWYNSANPDDKEKRREIIKKLFGKIGESFNIESNFNCDYGYNIEAGENFYTNYNCIILDVCKVTIGNNVMFAPNVQIYTAYHPVNPEVRNTGIEFGSPISIGDNVWIGGGVVILPGVKIGNNVTIGAGSVVTKDIPDNVVAAGNPCRVLRKI